MLLRIASRASNLAMAQTQIVANAITERYPDAEIEIINFTTKGDKTQGALWKAGGKGLFTGELEAALQAGQADIAVHSAKDIPARCDADLPIAAILKREDPRDAIILKSDCDNVEKLLANAFIGTSSLRRAGFVKKYYPAATCKPLRGNVETRIAKIINGEFDAGILAMAGLKRLNLVKTPPAGINITPLDVEKFIPAAGQGCIAIQCAANNTDVLNMLTPLDHETSRLALETERDILTHFGVGCHSCFAAHFRQINDQWQGLAMAGTPDGSEMIFANATAAEISTARQAIIKSLEAQNAAALLAHQE